MRALSIIMLVVVGALMLTALGLPLKAGLGIGGFIAALSFLNQPA